MKSNYVKYCLVALWITALFTSFQSSAFFVNSLSWCSDWSFPNCNLNTNGLQYRNNTISSDYDDFNSLNYYYKNSSSNWWNYYTLNSGDYISNGFLKSYNDWDWVKFGWYNYDSSYSFVAKTTYNFIKLWKEGSIPTFSMWSDLDKKYITRSTIQLPNIWNGAYTDSFEYFAPRHDSFVFYNAWYKSWFQTIQFIWSQVLDKYFVYVDTLDNSDNVWLIDLYNLKAWSMYVDDVDLLSQFLFWSVSLSPDYIDNYWRQYSYDVILNDWWNSFYPLTAWNRVCSSPSYASNWNSSNMWFTSCSRYNVGLTYVNTIFEKPNFWWWGNNDSSWSGDNEVAITYQQCVNTYTPINTMAMYIRGCNKSSSFDNDIDFVINYYSGAVYTWSYESVSCKNMINYANDLYNLSVSSGAYRNKVELAITYSDYDMNIDELLSLQCSKYMSDDEKYQALDLVDKINYQFNSWYNYFNVPKCIENYYWKSYDWWNYLLLFIAWFIFFTLFTAF